MAEEHAHKHAHPPDPMTEVCSRYFRDHWALMGFIEYVTHLATRADEGAKIAAETFLKEPELFPNIVPPLAPERQAELEKTIERGAGAIEALRAQRHLVLQMMLCRGVDNCLTYISEIMALIFRTKPETLKSSETMRVDVLLEHESMDDLISTLTERRVDQLAYQGMADLSADLSERLGFSLFRQDDELERAVRIVEIRNLIVHNRAVANRRFLSRLPDFPAKFGETLELSSNDVFDDLEFLAQSCADIDGHAAKKFDLPQPISGESLIKRGSEG